MTTNQLHLLCAELCAEFERTGRKVQFKINDNRQTMLSVRWEPHQTKVSLHRMFLNAPQNVMQALASYIKQEHKAVSPEIKAFIEANRMQLDYSYLVDPKRLQQQGEVYHLKAIYEKINDYYFKNRLQLSITWFGSHRVKRRSHCSLGLYYDALKLIKIHRLLDDAKIPEYVVEFVVYHEMLHAICPAYIDGRGMHRVHGAEFKRQEEQFIDYELATDWIKKHQMAFFLFGEA